jgi:hypothetical protein
MARDDRGHACTISVSAASPPSSSRTVSHLSAYLARRLLANLLTTEAAAS